MQKDSAIDNVLLEWSLILELLESKTMNFVLPILIGKVSADKQHGNGSFSTNLFHEELIPKLPQVVCTKVIAIWRACYKRWCITTLRYVVPVAGEAMHHVLRFGRIGFSVAYLRFSVHVQPTDFLFDV